MRNTDQKSDSQTIASDATTITATASASNTTASGIVPEAKASSNSSATNAGARDEAPAAPADNKEISESKKAIATTLGNRLAFSDASNMDIAVGTTVIHDMVSFLTGDPKITDFKLRYISYLAGYNGADLKGKSWSFAKGCDYRFYIYPETLEEAFQAVGDFSMKKTYGTLSNVLSKLPKVEIRSFAQRTLLQSIADGIGTAVDDVVDGVGKTLKALWNNELLTSSKEMWDNVTSKIMGMWESEPSKETSLFGAMVEGITPEKFKGGGHAALLNLPFIFYYCLASSVTRCYFALPLDSRSYENLWGSATKGWTSGTGNVLGDIKALNSLSDFGITSLITTAIARSFGMQFAPGFSAASINTEEREGELDLTFVLMNDTEEHAAANVSFLRVLFPSAMWSNVGVFAISGDLFDVKVKGAMRWLMCTGSFKCTPVGAIRTAYGTKMKIPDAYKVQCTFKSLIPNNLNNYLLGCLTQFAITGRSSVLGKLYQNVKDFFIKKD